MKYKIERTIDASMTDFQMKLSYIGMFQLVEDAVTNLMHELEIDGAITLKKYHAIWVFVKNKIKILKQPSWSEHCQIESFISSFTSAKLYIDTAIYQENELILYSKIELCALDLATQRIKKVQEVGVTPDMNTYPSLVDISFSKINLENETWVAKTQVQFTNIDYCIHTNNVEYIRFIMNTFSVKELTEKKIKEIQIHYVNQSFEGELLDIYTTSLNPKQFEIRNQDKTLIKAEILF